MYTPPSSGDVKQWTHPATIEFVEKTGMVKKVNQTEQNCSAGHIFLDFTNTTAVNMIFKSFNEVNYLKGFDTNNHRQDEAAITILLHNTHLA